MMNRFIKVVVLSFLLCSCAYGQEYLDNMKDDKTPVLNEELRKIRKSVRDAETLVSDTIPTGVIVMWHGSVASIPSGWALCNGSNGTPDLRNRFIVCADADDSGVAKTTLTGSATQSGNSNVGEFSIDICNSAWTSGSYIARGNIQSGTLTLQSGEETYPKYYALCFIMKT